MGDIVTCKCVLKKNRDRSKPDSLSVGITRVEGDEGYREIQCKPRGSKVELPDDDRTVWEYDEDGMHLNLSPSLLCLSTGFHTNYHWRVEFMLCPAHLDQMYYFMELNPDYDPSK